jgi:hypothetical protein
MSSPNCWRVSWTRLRRPVARGAPVSRALGKAARRSGVDAAAYPTALACPADGAMSVTAPYSGRVAARTRGPCGFCAVIWNAGEPSWRIAAS